MTNPWIKRNPLLSMYLSAANSAAGQQRAVLAAEFNRQQVEFARLWINLWTEAWLAWLPGKR